MNIRIKVVLLFIVFLSAGMVRAQEAPWTFTPSSLSHTIFIAAENVPTIDQSPLDSGDYIGVFFLNDQDQLQNAGFTQWRESDTFITAYGDDGITDGFLPGETFQFRIWRRNSQCVIQEFEAEYLTGGLYTSAETFESNGISGISNLSGRSSSITYSTAQLCSNGQTLIPILSSTPDQLAFSSSNGLQIDVNTGAIDPSQSEPGVYTVTYMSNTCLVSNEFGVTISDAPVIDLPATLSGCDSVVIGMAETPGNTYLWSTGEKSAEIAVGQSGNYSVQVTALNQCQSVESIRVVVSPPLVPGTVNPQTEFAPCATEGRLLIDAEAITGGITPFDFSAQNIEGKIFTSSDGMFDGLPEGSYHLTLSDSLGCTTELSNVEFLNRLRCETAVLTPNNDGATESLFIEESGRAQVYDRNGIIRKEIAIPAYWDGKSESGEILPMGIYLIVVNGTKKMTVTIVR